MFPTKENKNTDDSEATSIFTIVCFVKDLSLSHHLRSWALPQNEKGGGGHRGEVASSWEGLCCFKSQNPAQKLPRHPLPCSSSGGGSSSPRFPAKPSPWSPITPGAWRALGHIYFQRPWVRVSEAGGGGSCPDDWFKLDSEIKMISARQFSMQLIDLL